MNTFNKYYAYVRWPFSGNIKSAPCKFIELRLALRFDMTGFYGPLYAIDWFNIDAFDSEWEW